MRFQVTAPVGAFPITDVRALLTAFATQYGESALSWMTPCPSATFLQLRQPRTNFTTSVHDVSKARISFLRKRPAPASVEAAPPTARQRQAQAQEAVGEAAAAGRDV